VASINYATREISCKIVYYGPGLSGKTTNLQIIHRKIPDKDKSEMVSLATETDRTLFFDFLPLDLGSIKGFSTKFQLYTVPGQVYYNATRKLVLRGVDGVVFVVDSQMDKLQENLESFANLQENLREYGHSIENIPLVLQYNKRDLPDIYSVEQLNSLVNKLKLPHYEAVAATGVGVFTTLKGIGKSVIDKFNAKYAGFQGTRRPARPGDASSAPVVAPVAAPQQPRQPAPAPRPAPNMPQAFPGGFGGAPSAPPIPGPQAFQQRAPEPNFRAPLNVPQPPQPFSPPQSAQPAPTGFTTGSNPFAGNTGFPTSAGFPGAASSAPATPQPFPNMPSSPAPVSGPAPTGGFGGGLPNNPFTGGNAGIPPSFGSQTGSGGIPKPVFSNPFSSPSAPPSGNVPAPGGIPVSPFVEGFATAKPAFPQSPAPNLPPSPPSAMNPFSAPPTSQGFGQPTTSFPPAGQFGGSGYTPPPAPVIGMPGLSTPQGFPTMPGGPQSGGFGQGNAGGFGNPGSGFGAPTGFPSGGPAMGSPFQPNPGSGPGPLEPLPPSNPKVPNSSNRVDTSGMVSTYDDIAKDDSFKTKKLPNPGDKKSEKKKGFFDGLFKKDK
jgi:signal recognition particle receptor subunit beta